MLRGDEKDIRNFLVKLPRPARILVKTEDEEVHEVAPPTGKGGVTWAGVARSILAMQPVLIEAYDAEQRLLRAERPQESEVHQRKAGEPLPGESAMLAALHSDPETARLTHFANLLYRATEFSTTLAFSKMVELFQIQSDRGERLESRLERAEANYRRMLDDRVEEAFEQAAEIRDQAQAGNQDMAMQMLQGFMQGAAERNSHPPKPNGKG